MFIVLILIFTIFVFVVVVIGAEPYIFCFPLKLEGKYVFTHNCTITAKIHNNIIATAIFFTTHKSIVFFD